MELSQQIKFAKHIFRLLKVDEIVFPIGRTNKGNLGIKFSTQNDEFEIMLDAVPLPTKDTLKDENNIELKKMLEKYWFNEHDITYTYVGSGVTATVPHTQKPPTYDEALEAYKSSHEVPLEILDENGALKPLNSIVSEKKKRGRPVGSKNKK